MSFSENEFLKLKYKSVQIIVNHCFKYKALFCKTIILKFENIANNCIKNSSVKVLVKSLLDNKFQF